jgi:hypothetical protein
MRRCARLEGATLGEGAFAPGPAIWAGGREVAHFEAPDELHVRLTRALIRERRTELRADERIELRPSTSDRIRVRVATAAGLDAAFALVRDAVEANRNTRRSGL